MNGLLICSGDGKRKNIGDYIQSVAQEQFLEHVDYYVEREKLDEFCSTQKTNLIMNGWFMRHPTKFPPSEWINPLFVSFHIVPRNAKKMLTEATISYLKKYQPIGARDTGTQMLLQSYGIDSYFSGCLTLTLGLKYSSEIKDGSIYFVDPYYEIGIGNRYGKLLRHISALYYSFKYCNKINKIDSSFTYEFHTSFFRFSKRIDRILVRSSFYHSYSTLFSDELLFQAKFVTHSVKQSVFVNDDDKMEYARQLLRKYSKARLVITSRIHCGLPCLGIETPVLFVTSNALEGDSVRSSGRFGGLVDLFHTLRWTEKGIVNTSNLDFSFQKKIGVRTIIKNKEAYKEYKAKLIKTVSDFLCKG